jgi:poly(ADP-ribose) glycohydrolase ARH3
MIGSALGDAIGEMAFQYPDKEGLCEEVGRAQKLRYTDDTAMAIGLAESLKKLGRVEPQDLGDTFSQNYAREPWRGYASGPPTVFSMVERSKMSYLDVAGALFGGSGSFGNGAAMRIAPVGLFFHDSDRLYEEAAASAAVTHAHPVGKDGAAVQALAIAQAVRLDPKEAFPQESFAQALFEFSKTPEIREKMGLVRSLFVEEPLPDEVARRLGRSVAVDESLPFAIYSFLRHPKSFEECLFCAVLHGGDRDTLGAMACAISGAYLGIGGIPEGWQAKLENGPYIGDLAMALADKND